MSRQVRTILFLLVCICLVPYGQSAPKLQLRPLKTTTNSSLQGFAAPTNAATAPVDPKFAKFLGPIRERIKANRGSVVAVPALPNPQLTTNNSADLQVR